MQSSQETRQMIEQDKTSTVVSEEVSYSFSEAGDGMDESPAIDEIKSVSPEADEERVEGKKSLAEDHVIQEMIATERSYNEALGFLNSVLSRPDLVNDIPVLVEFKEIVPQLKIISDKLLENVEKAVLFEADPVEIRKLREQRTQLLKAFFSLYPKCCSLYTAFAKEDATNPKLFQDIKQYVTLNNSLHLDLASFLIQPFQRGPRYSMLIASAISSTKGLSSDQIEDLSHLLKTVREKLLVANSSMPSTVVKPYEVGDLVLRPLYRYFTQASESVTPAPVSPKKEEKSRPASSVPVSESLEQINSGSADTANVGSDIEAAKSAETAVAKPESRRYHFGDYTRSFLGSIWSKPAPQPAQSSHTDSAEKELEETDDLDENFVVVDKPNNGIPM